MSRNEPFIARWGQTLVLAGVVLAAQGATVAWLRHELRSLPTAGAPGPGPGAVPGASIGPVDPSFFDAEMRERLRQEALDAGLDPSTVPPPEVLFAQLDRENWLQSHGVDLSKGALERAEVERLLVTYVAEAGQQGGFQSGSAVPSAGGSSTARGGGGTGASGGRGNLTPEEVDQRLAQRVATAAREKGLDPEAHMPSAELRQAAIRSGSMDSAETQALVADYARVLQDLGAGAEPAAGGAPRGGAGGAPTGP